MPEPKQALPGWSALITLSGAIAVALLIADVGGHATPGLRLRPVADSLNVVATALFFGAGVFRYARWRVTGETYTAASSAALLVFAVATFPLSMAARDAAKLAPSSLSSSVARLLTALAVAAILAPALHNMRRWTSAQPLRLVAVGLVTSVGAFVTLTATVGSMYPVLASSAWASVGLDAAAALFWLGMAALLLRVGVHTRSASAVWSSTAMALISGATALRAAAGDLGGWPWLVAVGALTLLASIVSVANAGADTLTALSHERQQLTQASDALTEAEQLLAATEARRAELVHDARSMIGALQAAAATLDRHAEQLDIGVAHRLRAGMAVELERLGRLLDGSAADPPEVYSIADVVDPLVAMMQAEDLEVGSRLGDLWAVGRPDDVAEALGNLLVNAQVHAPGSPVTVRGELLGPNVRILVEDRGPGIAAAPRSRIFDRGVAMGPAHGSGLGLHIARRLLREQGGDLEIVDRDGGGTRCIVSLPAAPFDGAEPGRSGHPPEPVEEAVKVGDTTKWSGYVDITDVAMGRRTGFGGNLDHEAHPWRGTPRVVDDDQVDGHVRFPPVLEIDGRVAAKGQSDG